MAKITIRQWSGLIESGRRTILDAALKAGVPYPHSCRSGDCGACKTRVLSGETVMEAHNPDVLSRMDKQRGLILACRARARTDVEIEWLHEAAAAPQHLAGRIHSIETPTPDIRLVRVTPDEPLSFAAGQYVRLRFGRLPARAYSMANRPEEPVLEFHVRLLPNGLVGSHLARKARPGDPVTIEGPFGEAWLRDDDRPLVAVAGGTGLAPIRSIVRTAVARDRRRPVRVYLGFRDEADVYGERELARLAAVEVVLSRPMRPTRLRTGLVHEALADDLPSLAGATLHAAGPPAMVKELRRLALSAGLPEQHLHTDPFTAAGPAVRSRRLLAGLRGWLPGLSRGG